MVWVNVSRIFLVDSIKCEQVTVVNEKFDFELL